MTKSTLKPRLKNAVAAAGLCLAVLMGSAVPALAADIDTYANTGDTYYKFTMADQGTWATDGRSKEDTSSTYIQVATITMPSCRVYVDAKTWSGWKNETVKGYATARKTGQWCIRQDVYENHGRVDARLSAWANNGAGTLAGYWSPDSWGTYTAINGD